MNCTFEDKKRKTFLDYKKHTCLQINFLVLIKKILSLNLLRIAKDN